MHPKEIKDLIESGMTNSIVHVEGDDGAHFQAIVVSPEFTGKSRLQKQQLVYATVQKHLLDGTIHALSTKTFTPEEWQQANSQKSNDENRGKL